MISTLNPTPIGTWSSGFSSTSNGNAFSTPGPFSAASTEATTVITVDFGHMIVRARAVVTANGKDGTSTLTFRDDGVDVGSLSVGAGATGAFDSGALTTRIAANSAIAFRRDTSASTTGTLAFQHVVTYQVTG